MNPVDDQVLAAKLAWELIVVMWLFTMYWGISIISDMIYDH